MKYLKISALIAGLSIATVSVPQVKALASTDFLNQKNQITSNSLQKEVQAQPYLLSSINTLSSSNLKAEAVRQDKKLQFFQDTQSDAKPATQAEPEQKGKLMIVNNTPFLAIVQLYKPDANQPNNYAYIPPCSTRSLLNTYSNKWKVSFNNQNKQPIGNVSYKEGNTFNVITSVLNQDQDAKLTCQYENSAKPVVEEDLEATMAALSERFESQKQLIALQGVEQGVGEHQAESARIAQQARSSMLESLPKGALQLSTEDQNKIRELLATAQLENPDEVIPSEFTAINKKLQQFGIQFDSQNRLKLSKKIAAISRDIDLKIPSPVMLAQNTSQDFFERTKQIDLAGLQKVGNYIRRGGQIVGPIF